MKSNAGSVRMKGPFCVDKPIIMSVDTCVANSAMVLADPYIVLNQVDGSKKVVFRRFLVLVGLVDCTNGMK